MNIWENAVMTNQGIRLLTKVTAGNTLKIIRAVTGSGYVTPGLLPVQTDVSGVQQTLIFNAVSYPEEGKCAIPCYLRNDELTAGYTAMQVGVYAEDPDDGEILYFIAQAANGTGTRIPSKTEMPGYSAEWTFYVCIGSADSVTVMVDPSGVVSQSGMETYVKTQLKGLSDQIDDINDGIGDIDTTLGTKQAITAANTLTIPATGWSTDDTVPGYTNYIDIPISGLLVTDMVSVITAPASAGAARAANFLPVVQSYAGKIRLRAETVPAAAITAQHHITATNGTGTVYGPFQVGTIKHPSISAAGSGLYKIAVDANGHITSKVAATKKDIEDLGISSGGSGGGFVAQDTAPSDVGLLWVDTASGGVMKYYNGSAWVTTAAVWG